MRVKKKFLMPKNVLFEKTKDENKDKNEEKKSSNPKTTFFGIQFEIKTFLVFKSNLK